MRSRIRNDIQRLHGTMPLWGVDRWVPLGDLFVDVNILEQVSSNRRAELDDLWQDFTKGNSSYRSLDRIGLGKKQQRVSGLSVLERNTNLMVVGKPGSGKTTYLQRIVTECNDGKLQALRIPVLIRLREFVDDGRKHGYNLEQFLSQLWQLSNADIELVLNQGRTLVLLDGLDEVTGEAEKQITKEIKRFARFYPQVQMVVTCRTQSRESRFERFDDVEVADFNEEQVRAFAAHWFGVVIGNDSAGLAQSQKFLNQLFLEANQSIRDLAITPILLSLTCAVFHQTGKFYPKRSKLYEEGLELLLERWDKSREIERDEIYRDLSPERKLDLLSYLAVKKFEQAQYVLFEQEELEGYIAEFLEIELRDSRAVLKAIASQHGLLIERAHKVWSFSHLTFQEYFVAQYIITNNDYQSASKYIVSRIQEAHWREIFIITIELIEDTESLIKHLKEKIDSLLAKDEKLQSYLQWLKIKSQSLNTPYKLEAIRYFYFVLTNKVNYAGNNEFLLLNPLFMSSWDYDLGLDKRMTNSLASNFDPDVAMDEGLILGINLDIDNTIELNLDRSLMRILAKFTSSQQRFIENMFERCVTDDDKLVSEDFKSRGEFPNIANLFEDIESEFEIMKEKIYFAIAEKELVVVLERAKIADKPLYEALLTNREQLFPKFDNFESLEQWWLANDMHCIEEFSKLIIKYRSIGQDWEFNKVQTDSLWEYCELNEFLVDCLHNKHLISEQLHQEIFSALFMPIIKDT